MKGYFIIVSVFAAVLLSSGSAKALSVIELTPVDAEAILRPLETASTNIIAATDIAVRTTTWEKDSDRSVFVKNGGRIGDDLSDTISDVRSVANRTNAEPVRVSDVINTTSTSIAHTNVMLAKLKFNSNPAEIEELGNMIGATRQGLESVQRYLTGEITFICGNGTCEVGEDADSCSADCSRPPAP